MPVKNILVVDDSPTERFFTVDILTKAGYQVITAENGEEGIAKAKTDKIWGLRQGAVDYLVKPLNPEELLQRVAALP